MLAAAYAVRIRLTYPPPMLACPHCRPNGGGLFNGRANQWAHRLRGGAAQGLVAGASRRPAIRTSAARISVRAALTIGSP